MELIVSDVCREQKKYYRTGMTRSYQARITVLRALKNALHLFHDELLEAAYRDFQRVDVEVVASELAYLTSEIEYTCAHLAQWLEPKKVSVSWREWGARAQVVHEPYGVIGIIAPWNFPYVLSLLPAVHALAAGNTVILKPSEHAPHQARMIEKIISYALPPFHGAVVMGGAEQAHQMIDASIEYLFFTGSTRVGRLVYEQAARALIPVALELGGKCPAIVTPHADVAFAARTITWGKCFNAGQTCIAPDYAVVHRSVLEQFIEQARQALLEYYGENPQKSADFARIVSHDHVERLARLLEHTRGTVICGGTIIREERYCSPTLLRDCSWDDALMQEEIFGPILPVLVYESLEELCERIAHISAPLAIYGFTRDDKEQQRMQERISAGSYTFNDCLVQGAHPELPFGGVGASGFGRYHGHDGFALFSRKTVVYTRSGSFWLQNAFRPPYRRWLMRILFK